MRRTRTRSTVVSSLLVLVGSCQNSSCKTISSSCGTSCNYCYTFCCRLRCKIIKQRETKQQGMKRRYANYEDEAEALVALLLILLLLLLVLHRA